VGCVPAHDRVKRETYTSCHFYVKLAPEFVDAKLIICITFPDKPGEVLAKVFALKFGRG
jgi:hypothetical protein